MPAARAWGSIERPGSFGGISSNLLLYGKSGSGKTSSVLYVTSMLKETLNGNINIIYINCEIYDSQYSILVYLTNAVNSGDPPIPILGLPQDKIYFELVKRLNKSARYTVIILDEIELMTLAIPSICFSL